jgi:hypothetical protein
VFQIQGGQGFLPYSRLTVKDHIFLTFLDNLSKTPNFVFSYKWHEMFYVTSLKSPILGMWFFLVLPITLPVFDITTREEFVKLNANYHSYTISKFFFLKCKYMCVEMIRNVIIIRNLKYSTRHLYDFLLVPKLMTQSPCCIVLPTENNKYDQYMIIWLTNSLFD